MTSDTNIIDGPYILPLEKVIKTYNANNAVQIDNESQNQKLLMETGQGEVLKEGQGNENTQKEKEGAMQNLLVEGDSQQNKKRSQETEEKESKKRGDISIKVTQRRKRLQN